ncbi:amino acid transporter AVT3B [Hyalella azteca]|uniref:Amino acid transporter AVT3B n=1 Tax=Hyalella azteca TaxID=294128 RepID=A0A8B7NWL1_HYAAZ|nr:amino acid transporter AVT3B [Hyalella azteca]
MEESTDNNNSSSVSSDKVEIYHANQSPYWPTVALSQSDQTVPFSATADTGPDDGVGPAVAALFIVAEIAGAGILNLPYAVAETGWSGLALLIVLAVMVTFSGTRLSQSWLILEQLWPQYRTVNRAPYQNIAYRAFGKWCMRLLEASFQVTLLGAGVVYLLVIAGFVSDLWNEIGHGIPEITFCEAVLMLGIILTPVTWLGSPKDFWWSSLVAVGTTMATLVVIVVQVVKAAPTTNPVYTTPTLQSFSLGFGSILFSLGGASMFPAIQNDMKNREKFSLSVITGFVILDVMYMAVSATCYSILGSDVPTNILDVVTGPAGTVVTVLLLGHFLFAFVITVNPSMQSLEELLGVAHRFGLHRVILRSVVMAGVTLTALLIPNFSQLLSLLGGATVSMMSFICPPVFYWRLCSFTDPVTEQKVRTVSILQKLALSGIVMLGVVGGTAATYSAISAIIGGSNFNTTCFTASSFLGANN